MIIKIVRNNFCAATKKEIFLFEVDELHIKDQSGVGWDTAGDTLGTISHVRRDGQLGSLAFGHLGNSLIPSSNNLTINNSIK